MKKLLILLITLAPVFAVANSTETPLDPTKLIYSVLLVANSSYLVFVLIRSILFFKQAEYFELNVYDWFRYCVYHKARPNLEAMVFAILIINGSIGFALLIEFIYKLL